MLIFKTIIIFRQNLIENQVDKNQALQKIWTLSTNIFYHIHFF